MYLNFYSLNKEPFQITPDPAFLFMSPGHREALASIIYGVEKKKGFVLIIGAVGVGKTTILRAYLEKAEKEKLRAIYLFNSNISYNNLLKYILRELGLVPQSDGAFEMVNQIHEALIEEYRQGRIVLLLIDEAQNMPVDTLENLRMLSNLETATEKLIQIVFSAQPEFEKTLNLEELRQLKQRIAVKTVICPLSADESLTYIQHRLRTAAEKELEIFTRGALNEIIRTARGIPRVINVLCDNCLITAFGYGKKKVGAGIVREITRDFSMERPMQLRWALCALLVVLVGLLAYLRFGRVAPLGPKIQLSSQVLKVPQRQAPEAKAAVAEEPPPSAAETGYVHRVVVKGDTLAKMILDVYGRVDPGMIRRVKKANPHINNENVIIEGVQIAFPVNRKAQ